MAALVLGPGLGIIAFLIKLLIRTKGNMQKILESDKDLKSLKYYILIISLIFFIAGYFGLIF